MMLFYCKAIGEHLLGCLRWQCGITSLLPVCLSHFDFGYSLWLLTCETCVTIQHSVNTFPLTDAPAADDYENILTKRDSAHTEQFLLLKQRIKLY